VLVVEKLDRLSRQEPRITQRWMEDLTDCGLSIATVDGGRVYDAQSLRANLMETFEILMRAQLAHQESQQKSDRVRDRIRRNMERAKATGQVITAKAPGWLIVKPDRSGFTVIEERAAIVRRVYQMAAEGKGPRWIARELNEDGIPAWGSWRGAKSTRTWETSSVALMLRHPAVEGDYVPGVANTKRLVQTQFKERIVGYFPRVVDADLVARARAAMATRSTGPRTGGRHARGVANLFAGVAVCGACGNKVHLRTNGDANPQRHWQCQHAARGRGCQQKAMFRYAPFERAALDEILHLALDNNFFAVPERTQALSVEVAMLDKDLADRRDESRRLVKVLARVEDAPEIETELAALRSEMRSLDARRNTASAALEAARGAVSPREHLERVRSVRDALDDPDAVTRQAARLRVQQAIQGLGVQVVCGIDEDGSREIGLFLKGGVYSCVFDNDGKPVMRFDKLDLLDEIFDAETPEALAEIAARFTTDGPEHLGNPDRAWLATIIRRRQEA
jgi:DNA invertase Pin-like site-specific DNA recombinase